MSWRDVVRKNPPLTPEDEEAIQELMRWRHMDREDAERHYRFNQRRKSGRPKTSNVSHDDYMRSHKSEEFEKLTKVKCPQCKGKEGGCKHCQFKGFHEQASKGRGFTR